MNKSTKKFGIRIIDGILGKARLQWIFEYLFSLSLMGLNYGNGGDFKRSGELNVLKYIDKIFGDEALVLFDVGGNVGNYTKALAHFFNTRATIHAFEPSKKTYELFIQNTQHIKGLFSNNFGLSNIESLQVLYSNREGSGLASIYQRNLEHLGARMDRSEEVKLYTIDSYCKKNQIARIHFLKLDIEGHELKALEGAKEMLTDKKIDVIQFEFSACNIDSRTYFKDFYTLLIDNYRIYRILKDGIFEISTYKERYEIFQTINFLAVKR